MTVDSNQPPRIPPPELAQLLEGLEFPLSRQALVDFVSERCGPSAVITLLQRIPDRQYADAAAVIAAVSQVP